MNNMNNWIEHLHHPLVFAGFGLFIVGLLLRPLFLNNKKISGAGMERLLHKGMILIFILAFLAIIGGIALNWKATPAAVPEKTGKLNPGQSIQQYEKRLRLVEQQLLAVQASGTVTDDKERQLLETKLKAVQENLANLQQNYEEELQRRRAADKALSKMKGQLPEAKIAAAQKSLEQGDTEAAEQVFDEVADKEGKSVALAAFQSGQLAEGRVDYSKAMRQYRKAVDLEDDNPGYLLAAGRMACTLADYDQAQEWLTKMPIEMNDDQTSDFIDLTMQLLYDTGRYREIREMSRIILLNTGLKALYGKGDWGIAIEDVLLIAVAVSEYTSSYLDFKIGTIRYLQLFKQSIHEALLAYQENENLEEAVSVLYSYLGVMEATLGQDHPEVAYFCNNLSFFYLSQRDYKKAAPLIQRALEIKEKTLGKNHPSMAITLNNLALMHILQEHYDEAESLYQRSLNIVSTSFGNNHPQVAAALNNLAELYKIQGRDEEANSLHQRAAALQKAGNDKKTEELLLRIVSIIFNIDQAYYDDLKYEMAEEQ